MKKLKNFPKLKKLRVSQALYPPKGAGPLYMQTQIKNMMEHLQNFKHELGFQYAYKKDSEVYLEQVYLIEKAQGKLEQALIWANAAIELDTKFETENILQDKTPQIEVPNVEPQNPYNPFSKPLDWIQPNKVNPYNKPISNDKITVTYGNDV